MNEKDYPRIKFQVTTQRAADLDAYRIDALVSLQSISPGLYQSHIMPAFLVDGSKIPAEMFEVIVDDLKTSLIRKMKELHRELGYLLGVEE